MTLASPDLIRQAVGGAATRLAAGEALETKHKENRLRSLFAASLRAVEPGTEVRTVPEWRPELATWPSAGGTSRLGGFDLAVRRPGEDEYSIVCELKWSKWGTVDALDEALWDAFKLTHALHSLPSVTSAFLVYLAPKKAWEKPARFAEFWSEGFHPTDALITCNERIWRWNLKGGSKSCPIMLPPALQTSPVGQVELLIDGEMWGLRAASIRPNGDPWLPLDANGMLATSVPTVFDWPYPEPGLYMDGPPAPDPWEPPLLAHSDLATRMIPDSQASWATIVRFAATFNGYERWGGQEELGKLANALRDEWNSGGGFGTADLDVLRGCLFFEYRRFRHFGHEPGYGDAPYIRDLIEAIRQQVDS